MITAKEALEIFKKNNDGKIEEIAKVEGFGYSFSLEVMPWNNSRFIVDFNGNYKIIGVDFFNDNDPFKKAKKEIVTL